MHVQKNMNVYDDITHSYEIFLIQHILTHSHKDVIILMRRKNMNA